MEDKTALKISLLEEMPCAVLFVNDDGVIEYANDEACALLRKERRALLGRVCSDALGGGTDSGLSRLMDGAVREGRAFSKRRAPYRFDCGDGELYVTASPHSEGGVIFILEEASASSAKDSAMVYINELNRQLESRNKLIAETFGRFLSDDVVKDLLEDPQKANLGGKKCLITILMSDLRGFTALSEGMRAEEVLTMLNSYLGAMVDIISKYGGTIIEFIGDSIFAIFGAPKGMASHAGNAVACAVEMQRAMAGVNEYNAARGFPSLEMGIGINTGEVIVGNIGSERRMKYGVVGRHVNLCGRIESYSVGGQILVSPDTYTRLGVTANVADTLTVSPKGVKRPITLYSIDGLGAPYNISCRDENRPVPKRLLSPVPFEANVLSGKYIAPEAIYGVFTELSPIEAVAETSAELRPMDNLRLSWRDGGTVVFEEVFAKVIKRTENGYLIHFTAKNRAFEDYLRGLLKNER
ncbi:MAG: PAS domain-containing protein [Clostridia bacterium]|nr:PAS domain-containing protein [Clostridia bacterium]